MGSKIYVGGLPYSATDRQLRELFSPFGKVESVRIIADKTTGKSRGFGFVEMSSTDEARAAIEGLKGRQMDGRALMINEAKPQELHTGGEGFSGIRGGRRPRW